MRTWRKGLPPWVFSRNSCHVGDEAIPLAAAADLLVGFLGCAVDGEADLGEKVGVLDEEVDVLVEDQGVGREANLDAVLAGGLEVLRQVLVHQRFADGVQRGVALAFRFGVLDGVLEEVEVHVELWTRGHGGVAHHAVYVAVAIDLDLGNVDVVGVLHELGLIFRGQNCVVVREQLLVFSPAANHGNGLNGRFDLVQDAHVCSPDFLQLGTRTDFSPSVSFAKESHRSMAAGADRSQTSNSTGETGVSRGYPKVG